MKWKKLRNRKIKLNDFQRFEMIISFHDDIFTVKISIYKAIFYKIWYNLIIKLDQKKKIREKRETLLII